MFLVVNLTKTKTECVLYGTHQRTSRSKPMEVKINQTKITESDVYEYLGVKMDKNLTFSDHLKKTVKQATSRVKLLSRIRHNISPYTAETIYKVTILPILLYCNNVFLHMAPSSPFREHSGTCTESNKWLQAQCKAGESQQCTK